MKLTLDELEEFGIPYTPEYLPDGDDNQNEKVFFGIEKKLHLK